MVQDTEVIEREAVKPQIKREAPEVKKTNFPKIDYDGIANKLPIDAAKPPKPDSFTVGNTNAFDYDDEPTLSGRVMLKIYGELIKRKDAPEMPKDAVTQHNIAMKDFSTRAVEIAQSRKGEVAARRVTAALSRTEGTNGFHFDGERVAGRDHAYYFNKSTAYWRNPREGMTRAYVTVKPEEAAVNQQHFVNLSMEMFDAGIDFTAKATGVKGTIERTDNMVFYISNSDKDRAGVIMAKFLKDNPIAGGAVDAAIADKQTGLSWAPEPGKVETDFYQKVTGSSRKTSFNGFVAARAMPTYLDRLSLANARAGDTKSAGEYFTELKRVNQILLDVKEGR